MLAADAFLNNGVIQHSDTLASGDSDEQVAAAAIVNGAMLIAVDRGMRRLARRFGSPKGGGRFDRLHLISVTCNEVLAAKRLEHALSFIEHEWQVACAKLARRLWIDIGPHHLTSYR